MAIYSEGRYVSYNLDFVENICSGRRKLKKVLAEIGFQEEAKYFTHPETQYFLEFTAGPLAVGEESPQRIVVLSFETGKLAVLSPTDCVKDRYFHWNDQQCLEQALLVACASDVDLAEIERWSLKEGYEKKFYSFHDHLKERR